MLENIKEFAKEHEAIVAGVTAAIASVGLIAIGCKLGRDWESWRIESGLNKCFEVCPELEPMMKNAIKKAQETFQSK